MRLSIGAASVVMGPGHITGSLIVNYVIINGAGVVVTGQCVTKLQERFKKPGNGLT
jgi:hypothetical protein